MKLRNCEIMQQLSYMDMETFIKGLENPHILKYAYIVHDKDVYTDEEEKKNPLHKAGTLKPAHIHCMLSLDNAYAPSTIGNWFKIEQQYVTRVKGRMSDALAYLTHENAPDKYQYEATEVKANYEWTKVKQQGEDQTRKEEIVRLIANGTIKEYNYTRFINEVEYDKFANSIRRAYEWRSDYVMNELEKGNRTLECIFIQGESGSGKTTYAKEIAKKRNLDYFISGSTKDPLQNYKGQPCVILDDIRASTLALTDLLKLLDNNTATSVPSRYRDKYLECELIIITTVQSVDGFFKTVFESDDEPVVQLKRRCETLIKMDVKNVMIYTYDKVKRDYEFVTKQENPINKLFSPSKLTQEEVIERLSKLPGIDLSIVKMQEFQEVDPEETPYNQIVIPFDGNPA